jgi:hypothetical protein
MFRQMYRFGKFMVVSRRNKTVRAGLLFLVRNFFLLTSILLAVEILLILLGINGICLPMTRQMREIAAKLAL